MNLFEYLLACSFWQWVGNLALIGMVGLVIPTVRFSKQTTTTKTND